MYVKPQNINRTRKADTEKKNFCLPTKRIMLNTTFERKKKKHYFNREKMLLKSIKYLSILVYFLSFSMIKKMKRKEIPKDQYLR